MNRKNGVLQNLTRKCTYREADTLPNNAVGFKINHQGETRTFSATWVGLVSPSFHAMMQMMWKRLAIAKEKLTI